MLKLNDKGYVDLNRAQFMGKLRPYFNQEEMESIEAAYFLSKYAHRPQVRDDGVRYFEHPKTVAYMLCELGYRYYSVIIVALLHDLLEDSFIMTEKFLGKTFTPQIANDVRILTKTPFTKELFEDPNQAYYDRLYRSDYFAKTVKIVDRIHNLRTMDNIDPAKAARKVAETEKFYPQLVGKHDPAHPSLIRDEFWETLEDRKSKL